ncbi:SRPBCC family protein [Streptomyces sp. NPDC038707]|uniref:SRPBCC family protein n=1 Tax=Streptomyces sp. NPDC038707 TaxID=3154329 RepID=UPI003408B6FC
MRGCRPRRARRSPSTCGWWSRARPRTRTAQTSESPAAKVTVPSQSLCATVTRGFVHGSPSASGGDRLRRGRARTPGLRAEHRRAPRTGPPGARRGRVRLAPVVLRGDARPGHRRRGRAGDPAPGRTRFAETVLVAKAPEVYAYRVDVINAPGARALVEEWRLTPHGTGTRVRWTFAADGTAPFRFVLVLARAGLKRAFRDAVTSLDRRLSRA